METVGPRGAMTDEDVLALYERSVDDVYRYATKLTGGDRAWADELVQDTYEHLLQRARDGALDRVDTGWLIVSCRHRFLDALKAQRRRRAREWRTATRDVEPVPDGGSFDATAALGAVPLPQRTVLVLRYVDDLAVPDVARLVGRSVRATESLLVRARASLRRALEEGGTS